MKKDIFISASLLDTWRYYKYGFIDDEEFLIRLQRKKSPNELMKVGTAFHKSLQDKQLDYNFVFHKDYGYENDYKKLQNFDYYELYFKKVMELNKKNVIFHGFIDIVDGVVLHEVKTTYKKIKIDKYLNSFQWKLYFLLTDAEKLIYDIFHLFKIDVNTYEIRDYKNIELYNPNDFRDIFTETNELIDFCEKLNFMKYLYIDNSGLKND